MSVDMSKWLLIAEESLHACCLLVLRKHFTLPTTSLTWNVLSYSLVTDIKYCNTKHKPFVRLLLSSLPFDFDCGFSHQCIKFIL